MKAVLALFAIVILSGPLAALMGIGLLVVPAGSCAPAPVATSSESADPSIPETTRIVMPLPVGTYSISDAYGWRSDPFTGERVFHRGTDFPSAGGTPILSATDGVIVFAARSGGLGNLVVVESTVDGAPIALGYAHIRDGGTLVTVGQHVQAGQQIAEVGTTGYSTGDHLHFQVEPGHWGGDTINSLSWLRDHDAEGISDYLPAVKTCS